ncbi:MAG: hypothetical protein HZB65_03860 [Candidatus Aenigmarchaeota archaeon]|nr:hypothetical protein [Candidatus Aenigmarchaeota archaeon]
MKIKYFKTIEECVGRYAALVYLNEIKEYELLELYAADLKGLTDTCKKAMLHELDLDISSHLCGYAAATLLFNLYRDAKLADASMAVTFAGIENVLGGYSKPTKDS